MADIPVLVCTAGELAGRRIAVPEGGIGIGRSPDNAVVIHDEGVSRYHGRLLFENGSLWLQDAGSRNGVFVNGSRVTGHKALKVGDSITIAQHTFELRWQDEDEIPSTSEHPPEPSDGSDSAGKPPTMSPGKSPAGPEVRRGAGGDESGSRRRWFWPFS